MIVGPILVTIAAGLFGIGLAERITAPADDFLAGLEWLVAGMFFIAMGSVWCLVASIVAVARACEPGRRWVLGLCINLASLAIVAAFIAFTATQ